VKLRILALVAALIGGGIPGFTPVTLSAAEPANTGKAEISAEARAAVQRMGETLRAPQFAFQAQTIRVYAGPKGEPLHIFHTSDVTVQRPNRLLVSTTGDDGPAKLIYDGKTVFIYIGGTNKYASIPAPGTIEAMMKEVMGRLGVDFPLADFLTEAPAKSFLSGVTAGEVVNTVTIDGVPCLHLFFSQPPGIELELWLEKTDQSLPRRLIVTYRSLPGVPSFIARFSNWNFSVHPSDSDFAFQPPAGATRIALKPPTSTAREKARGGAK
jgi:hypothetical protein